MEMQIRDHKSAGQTAADCARRLGWVEADPDGAWARLNLGQVLLRLGRYAEAFAV
jgi:hypothetical protein